MFRSIPTAPVRTGGLMTKYKQLTSLDRLSIETGLREGNSFKAIAKVIGKDCTTVSKEVRAHLVFRKSGAYGRAFNDCLNRKSCQRFGVCSRCCQPQKNRSRCSFCGKCTASCLLYKKEECPKLGKPPYVCNGCSQQRLCTLEKRFYDAARAQAEYRDVLSETRSGIALSDAERKRLDDIISPLLRQGQSLHHICLHHKAELMVSERTLYAYMDANLFSARNIDMPRKVRLRPRRKKPDAIKVDTKCREGRTMDDFKAFLDAHPDTPVVQLDSVEGTRGGAVLLTITFVANGLQLALRREHNDAQSVTDFFNRLYRELGSEVFSELFPVILADNGSEFSDPLSIEFDKDGNRRTRMFYCNASAPYQKGSCEVRHEMIRRIIPKSVDISLYSQAQIDTMMSHINSYRRKTLGNKSPCEMFAFQYGEEVLRKLGLRMIPPDEIILSPTLFN